MAILFWAVMLVLGLGLGLVAQVLGLHLGLGIQVLGFGLGYRRNLRGYGDTRTPHFLEWGTVPYDAPQTP